MNKLLFLLTCTVLSLGFVSCKNDDEPEPFIVYCYNAINARVWVWDKDGNNLLSKDNPDNILDEDMYMVIGDVTIKIPIGSPPKEELRGGGEIPSSHPQSRCSYYIWFGAFVQTLATEPHLYVGEWPGAYNWDEEFSLILGGETHKMRIINVMKDHDIVKREIYLDNQLQENNELSLILDR